MSKLSVLILFGGVSSEHDVSRISASSVLNNIDREKYDVHTIGITKDGKWYYFDGDTSLMPDGSWENYEGLVPAIVSPDRSVGGIMIFRDGKTETIKIDACFPVMHGRNGEDGSMQGLLEIAGIPYVGCDIASSAICMDKALTNTMLEACGIEQAKFVWFYIDDFNTSTEKYIVEIEEKLGYPCFIKPANAGSSVGITKATDRTSLLKGIADAAAHDPKIVIEENVIGAEVEVAVLGNRNPIASVVGEIVPANDWYDFEAKYHNASSELHIPARLSEEKQNEIRQKAIKAYCSLGCSGLSRVDFFVRESDGAVLLNEPNTLPGFTSISMYPKLFGATDIPYSQLIDKLIEYAIEKAGK